MQKAELLGLQGLMDRSHVDWYRVISPAGLYGLTPSAALSVFGGLVSTAKLQKISAVES